MEKGSILVNGITLLYSDLYLLLPPLLLFQQCNALTTKNLFFTEFAEKVGGLRWEQAQAQAQRPRRE